MKKALLDKIKTRGYWRIHFEPKTNSIRLNELRMCREIVEKNSVQLRGWDYPHIPRRKGDDTALSPGNNYWEGWLDWKGENHKEFWRMYQSGQFIHYLALREDWISDFKIKNMWFRKDIENKKGLSVTGTVYQITEIYQFLMGLIKDGLYKEGLNLSISLNNAKGRILFTNYDRVGFSFPRETSAEKIEFKQEYSTEEVLKDSKDLGLKTIVYFFQRFAWDPPNIEVIKKDQESFLAGRL